MKNFAILLVLTFIGTISCADDKDDILFKVWPCTVEEDKQLEVMLIQEVARRASDQAYTTLGSMEQYADEYAQRLQRQDDFNALLKSLKGKEWLRAFHWYRKEILPKEKKLGSEVPDSYLKIFNNQSQIILPKMHKALEMILGSLMEMKAHGFDKYDANIVLYLKKYIDDTIDYVKSLLCTVATFLLDSDITELLTLKKSEVPKITKENNGLLFRDTLNFLEYLSQVFQYLSLDGM